MLSYDPDKIPEMDWEAYEEAQRLGLHAIHVICDPKDAQVGEHTGVSFLTFAEFLPRINDVIDLENGTKCVVQRVIFRVTRLSPKLTRLMANVYAVSPSE